MAPHESEWCRALAAATSRAKITESPTQCAAGREKSRFPLENDRTPRVHFCRLFPPYRMRIPEGITEPRAVPHALERYREVRALSRNRGRIGYLPYAAYLILALSRSYTMLPRGGPLPTKGVLA